MKLGVEVGLSPGHIVLDGEPAPLPKGGMSLYSKMKAGLECCKMFDIELSDQASSCCTSVKCDVTVTCVVDLFTFYYSQIVIRVSVLNRSQKTETVKAGKSSTKSSSDKHLMESSRDTSGPADMDSCVTITDETVLADQSASTTTTDRTLHTVSKPSVTGRGNTSDTSAPLRTVVADAEVTDPAAKSTSRLFDLVNADSPVAQVSQFIFDI